MTDDARTLIIESTSGRLLAHIVTVGEAARMEPDNSGNRVKLTRDNLKVQCTIIDRKDDR